MFSYIKYILEKIKILQNTNLEKFSKKNVFNWFMGIVLTTIITLITTDVYNKFIDNKNDKRVITNNPEIMKEIAQNNEDIQSMKNSSEDINDFCEKNINKPRDEAYQTNLSNYMKKLNTSLESVINNTYDLYYSKKAISKNTFTDIQKFANYIDIIRHIYYNQGKDVCVSLQLKDNNQLKKETRSIGNTMLQP